MLEVFALAYALGMLVTANYANTKWRDTGCVRRYGCPFSLKNWHLVVLSQAVGLLVLAMLPYLGGVFSKEVTASAILAVGVYAFVFAIPYNFYLASAMIMWLRNESRYREVAVK